MFKNILVPLDGSKVAAQALPLAARLARQSNAKLHLLSAIQVEYPAFVSPIAVDTMPLIPDVNALWSQAQDYLANVVSGDLYNGLEIVTTVDTGEPAQMIVDSAEDAEADLIIMTTHGRSGFSRWALGSVTERVLRHAPCPVLAVRENTTIKHILIALDGSELAEATIEPSLELAKQTGAKVTFLRVDDKPVDVDYQTINSINHIEPGMADILARSEYNRAEEYVEMIARRYRDEGIEMSWLGITDNAANGILRIAKDRDCDVIAMSTHGRTGIRRWVYGSVTEQVLRAANRSMFIIRPEYLLKNSG